MAYFSDNDRHLTTPTSTPRFYIQIAMCGYDFTFLQVGGKKNRVKEKWDYTDDIMYESWNTNLSKAVCMLFHACTYRLEQDKTVLFTYVTAFWLIRTVDITK